MAASRRSCSPMASPSTSSAAWSARTYRCSTSERSPGGPRQLPEVGQLADEPARVRRQLGAQIVAHVGEDLGVDRDLARVGLERDLLGPELEEQDLRLERLGLEPH